MNTLSYYDIAILEAISWLSRNMSKHYCYPSQDALCEILFTTYHINRCRRTLNYHLSVLQSAGYLKRQRRLHEGENGQPVFASTLYYLCKRGFAYLGKALDRILACGVRSWRGIKGVVSDVVRPELSDLVASIGRPIPSG